MGHIPRDVGGWLRQLQASHPGPVVDHLLDANMRRRRPSTLVARWHLLHAADVDLDGLALVDEHRLRDWWRRLNTRGLAAATVCTYASHLRAFFVWAVVEDLRADDPTRRIAVPRRPRSQPKPVDAAQLRRLLAQLAGGRDWLPVALAAYCGLRALEVAAVDPADLRDLDTGHPALAVRGKGGHERTVLVPAELVAQLRRLPAGRPALLTRHGNPYTADEMSRRLGAIMRAHGVEASGHQLRHSFGTAMYRANRDLLATQAALGHTRPESTAIYARADPAAAQASAASAWATLGLDGRGR